MAILNTPNTAALASPIYNPDIDSTSQQLFNVMNNQGYPEDLVASYTQMITSLPTVSAFQGAIINPRACEISDVQTGASQLLAGVQSQYQSIILAGTRVPALTSSGYIDPSVTNGGASGIGTPGMQGYLPSISDAQTLQQWQVAMPSLTSDLQQAADTMNDFQDHTDRLISNLPSVLGMIQGALGLATALGGLLNPCLGLNSFLGSLLGAGSAIMAKINAAVAYATSLINQGIGAIQAAVAKVKALISSLISMIEQEITKLVQSLIDAARLGLAQLLSLLPKDPCFAAVVKTVSTGATIGTLGL